eukprot:Hpha_TRINITY_DN14957_c0_g1::TRINITY_DN14957_c0_g1_i1::g.144774::m.144774
MADSIGVYSVPAQGELGLELHNERDANNRDILAMQVEEGGMAFRCGVPNGKLCFIEEYPIQSTQEAASAIKQVRERGQQNMNIIVRDFLTKYTVIAQPNTDFGMDYDYCEVTPDVPGFPPMRLVQIAKLVPGSPAERSGLPPGLYIVTCDGKPISSPEDLKMAVRTARARFQDGGGALEVHFEVAERPWELNLPDPVPPPPPGGTPRDFEGYGEQRQDPFDPPPQPAQSIPPPPMPEPKLFEAPFQEAPPNDSFSFGDAESGEDAVVQFDNGERFRVNYKNMQAPGGGAPSIRPNARIEVTGLLGNDAGFNGLRGTIVADTPMETGPSHYDTGRAAPAGVSGRRRQIDWQEWIRQRQQEEPPPNTSFGASRQAPSVPAGRGYGPGFAGPGRLGRTLSVLGGGQVPSSKSQHGLQVRGVSFAAGSMQRRKSSFAATSDDVRILERFSSKGILGTTQPVQDGPLVPGVTRVQSSWAPGAQSSQDLLSRPGTSVYPQPSVYQQPSTSIYHTQSRVMNTPPVPSQYAITASPSTHPPPGLSPRAQAAPSPTAYDYSVLDSAARAAPAGRFRVRVLLPPGASAPVLG